MARLTEANRPVHRGPLQQMLASGNMSTLRDFIWRTTSPIKRESQASQQGMAAGVTAAPRETKEEFSAEEELTDAAASALTSPFRSEANVSTTSTPLPAASELPHSSISFEGRQDLSPSYLR